MIDKIYYINLDKREDRNSHFIKNVIPNLPDEYDIERVSAIDMTKEITRSRRGAGCSLSHMKIWKDAKNKGYRNILVLEDDFEMTEGTEVMRNRVQNLFSNFPDFIVCNIAYNNTSPLVKIEGVDNFYYCHSLQTTSGYILNCEFIETLYPPIMQATERLLDNQSYHLNAIDQAWKVFQTDERWLAMGRIGRQMESYSDLEKNIMRYGV